MCGSGCYLNIVVSSLVDITLRNNYNHFAVAKRDGHCNDQSGGIH